MFTVSKCHYTFLVSLFVSYYHTPQELIWIKWTRHIYMKSFRTYALLRQCICVSATWDELSCHDNLIVFIFTESSFLFVTLIHDMLLRKYMQYHMKYYLKPFPLLYWHCNIRRKKSLYHLSLNSKNLGILKGDKHWKLVYKNPTMNSMKIDNCSFFFIASREGVSSSCGWYKTLSNYMPNTTPVTIH